MKRISKNSYKRKDYYITSLVALLTLVIFAISNYTDKRVYKVYIENRLVGVTAESPEVIEMTYNEVKAKKYAQGSDIIEEDITISEESIVTNQQLVDQDELAKRFYVELGEQDTVEAVKIIDNKIIEKTYSKGVEYVDDSNLYIGESKVIQQGNSGRRQVTIQRLVDIDGEAKEEVVENVILEEAKPKVIAVGIKEKPIYMVPVDEYRITSSYGPRWGRTHQGIDLAVSTGTPVASAADGVIIQSGWNGGYGISIYVDHGNGVITRYGHLSQAYAQVGRNVKQGEVIGLSGNTGNSTGPHLHFEIRIGDQAVNPTGYMEFDYE